jgi:tRNA-specific 2-thiouridylase
VKTVCVGLSGGVDSAVSAYLLKKQGYSVVGAFIKGWEPDFLPCTGKEDRLSAMQVAAHLGIPFVTYDLAEEYKRDVVDYFVNEYEAGRTPNPDVMCNRMIKFGSFWEKAKADGADFIATGHYAINDAGSMRISKDTEKDQTYFLWTLTKEDLAHSLFPIGNLKKEEVRRMAEKANLPNAKRRDSQGLCFLGHVDMKEFLKRYIPEKKGAVMTEDGEVVGEHDGVWFSTLGQRHGFRVDKKNGAADAPKMYVVGKDTSKNILYVSHARAGEKARHSFELTGMSSVSEETIEGKALARYRYRQPLLPVSVNRSTVTFDTPQSIASGQSCVFYTQDGEMTGGGIIA